MPQVIDVSTPGDRGRATQMFGVLPEDKEAAKLEQDGFPQIGTLLHEGDPYYRYNHKEINQVTLLISSFPGSKL